MFTEPIELNPRPLQRLRRKRNPMRTAKVVWPVFVETVRERPNKLRHPAVMRNDPIYWTVDIEWVNHVDVLPAVEEVKPVNVKPKYRMGSNGNVSW